MSFYGNLQATARRLLVKYGQDVTLRKYTLGAYDATTSSQARTSVDTVLKGVIFNVGDGVTQIKNELVKINDKKLLLDATGPVPTPKDYVIIGGSSWSILSINEINPGGTPVAYECHIRQ